MKALFTYPPMLGMIYQFRPVFKKLGVDLTDAKVVQTLTLDELKELVPQHDGWIIGDEPSTREVLAAGKARKLKVAVEWGVSIDNVDFLPVRTEKVHQNDIWSDPQVS
jgi:D-3-phosphoglycerate dehydrogenase